MIAIKTPDHVDKRIVSTDWFVFEITLLEIAGRVYRGTVTIMKRPGGSRQNFNWSAQYRGDEMWLIEGDGARLPSGERVPDRSRFPFTLDAIIDNGIKSTLVEWLNKNKSAKPLAPTNRNGAPAETNGTKSVRPVVSPDPVRVTAPLLPKPRPAPPPKVALVAIRKDPPPQVVISAPIVPALLPMPQMAAYAGQEFVVKVSECVVFQPDVNDPRFSGQPRKFFDEKKLKRFGKSLKRLGQKQPIQVKPIEGIPGKKWEIIDGERRWRASQLVGITELKAVVKFVKDKRDQHLTALILNFNKEGHTPLELSNALQEQVDAGTSIADLIDAVGASGRSTISRLLALQKMHAELKPLLDPPTLKKDRIPIMHGGVLARITPDRQVAIWNESRKQPTKALALAKIYELGKPHFVYTPRMNKRANPNEVAERIKRRVDRLALTLLELNTFTAEEVAALVKFVGTKNGKAMMGRLTAFGGNILEFKQRLSRAIVAHKDTDEMSEVPAEIAPTAA